ncbi:MAG: hypothetical protein AB8G05_20155 [Oligoflexales bacterium]
MAKKLILGLSLLSGISFSGEDLSSKEKKKIAVCLLKSDIIREHLIKECGNLHEDRRCHEIIEKIWQDEFESCIWNSKSNKPNTQRK